jgi:amidase
MSDLWKLSAVELAEGIRTGEFSCREVMGSVSDRVDKLNGRLNAITVDLREEATAAAAEADRAVAAGAELGPLHGVPVTIKENVDMAGLANTNGIPAFVDMIAAEDAPLVRNLKGAGAIVVGRTNVPEFSMRATTDNPLRGRTVNPWDEQASPGGSSGGAGVAAAAGFGPLHHGNDIGGSLRFPSTADGVCTVKPTSFRVPVFNSSAPAERGPLSQVMSVQGLIGREVRDVRLGTSVLIHPDPRDPNCPPVPWDGPPLADPVSVAVTTEPGGYDIHPGVVELVRAAADALDDAGYRVVEVDPPPVVEAAREWFRAGTTEMQALLDPAIRSYGSETIQRLFDWYYELSELLDRDGYIAAVGHRTRLMRQWNLFLDEHPLVLTPFLMRPLYDWDYDARGLEQTRDLFASAIYSTGINYLGLPAGVVATGFVEGRPSAVQLVGRRFREDVICDAMEAIQARCGILAHQLWARDGD